MMYDKDNLKKQELQSYLFVLYAAVIVGFTYFIDGLLK